MFTLTKKLFSSIETFWWATKQLILAAPVEIAGLTAFIVIQGIAPAASLYAVQGVFNLA